MKQLILAFLIVALVLSIGIAEQVFAHDTLTKVISYADDIIASLEKSNIKDAQSTFNALNDFYDSHRRLMELMYPHSEFRDIPVLLGELEGTLDARDIESALARAYVIRSDAESHLAILSFRIENIL